MIALSVTPMVERFLQAGFELMQQMLMLATQVNDTMIMMLFVL